MRIKLIWKFILVYLAVTVVCFILISTAGARLVDRTIISRKSIDLYNEATVISDDILRQRDTLPSIHQKLSAIAAYQQSVIWLMANDGSIITDSSSPYSEEPVSRVEGFDRVALGTGYYSTGRFFDYFNEEMLTVIQPLSSSYNMNGYLVIHMPLRSFTALRESILTNVHQIAMVIFLLSLVILVLIFVWVNIPVRKITAGAKEFASGNLKHTIGLKTGDELEYLSDTLDFMASELDKANSYQSAFIANVSHDFRSPLTSIKGYAEAMQDGTIPPELHSKYLGIVISEADRLNKLSQELITMKQVNNSGKRVLNVTDFDLNAMIRTTAASFEGTCYEKSIIIDLIMEEDALTVRADLTQIQQVMYNLIDNAVKFSRNNSTIEIETTERYNKAYIVVRDHGIGIASSEINKIWDRFYKADTSRGKDPRGSGLGLAIVKEIIQAHGEKINVISTPDVGTEFSFTLPVADEED
ncbi:MAG: HAMP domain-containing histidine kinase [Lachnospiraceae bacterium]|nr:HAMP domain-containing histidine kinase [Lachnospiraceae bacterium]